LARHRGIRSYLDPRRSSRRRCLPCPARHVLESALTLGLKGALGVVVALRVDPRTESAVIDGVGDRDSGVTVAFDVVEKSAEPFLLPVGARRRRL